MIVVISHAGDPHAMRVTELLGSRGKDVLLLDLSQFPSGASLTVDFDDCACAKPRIRYATTAGEERDLSSARAVWWRRPQAVDLAGITDPHVHAFTAGEWHEAIHGLWELMDAAWMNPPVRDEVAGRKLRQLQLARELGLAIPRTLVTSDPDEARRFVDRGDGAQTIFKTFSCTHQIWRETRLVGAAERGALDAVRLAPVIFQEYVPAEADIRVTAVGGRLFAAAIHSAATDYPVDFRMSLGQAEVEPTTLPADVTGRLLALMQRLGIVYGAFDFRRTPEGEHVFLEVNTAGEFLFVEERTGQPITAAVASWLADPAAGGRLLSGLVAA
jgi:glutathione synthase/RimK-type ligase-like ATP-grasp enzyme